MFREIKSQITIGILISCLATSLIAFAKQDKGQETKYLDKGSTVFEGQVVQGISQSYKFNARAGQRLKVEITPSKGDAQFSLLGGNSEPYADNAIKVRKWSDKLRRSGEYEVRIEALSEVAKYTLKIAIE
jgi:hypothetical protein